PEPVAPPAEPSGDGTGEGGKRLGEDHGPPPPAPVPGGAPPAAPRPRRFSGAVELDPVRAKLQFAETVDEVVAQCTALPCTAARANVAVEAQSAEGVAEGARRAARENATTRTSRAADFD